MPLDVDLGDLADHEGELVRVGGLVVGLDGARLTIDDGIARAGILLPGEAIALAADLRPGEAINVVGYVVRDGADPAVAARGAADLARVGSLGELAPLATGPASPATADPGAGLVAAESGLRTLPGGLLVPLVAGLLTGVGAVALRWRRAVALARRVRTRLLAIGPPIRRA